MGGSFQLFVFPAFTDPATVGDYMQEFYDQVTFYGNKIYKADKDKEVAWYKSLIALCEAVKQFITDNSKEAISWTGKEDGSGAAA